MIVGVESAGERDRERQRETESDRERQRETESDGERRRQTANRGRKDAHEIERTWGSYRTAVPLSTSEDILKVLSFLVGLGLIGFVLFSRRRTQVRWNSHQ